MLADPSPHDFRIDLAHSIERQILQRTWGRIHRLTVDVTPERLVVHGCTPSYYVKQLAIQAVLETLDSADAPAVEVDIQVGPVEFLRVPGRSDRLAGSSLPQ